MLLVTNKSTASGSDRYKTGIEYIRCMVQLLKCKIKAYE